MKSIFTIALLFAIISISKAQVVDQSNDSSAPEGFYGFTTTSSCSQTFTAGITGKLSKIEVLINNFQCTGYSSYQFKASILDGENSASVLAQSTETISIPFAQQWYTINFSSAPIIVKGKKYTISLKGITFAFCSGVQIHANWCCSQSGSSYDGGQGYSSSFNFGGDYYFKTYVIPLCDSAFFDCQNANFGNSFATIGEVSSPGQSFKPGISGDLQAFLIYIYPPVCTENPYFRLNYELIEGEGYSGKVIAEDTTSILNNGSEREATLSFRHPPFISQGASYTFRIKPSACYCNQSSTSFGCAMNSNFYSDGCVYFAGKAYPDDLYFKTIVSTNTFSFINDIICGNYSSPSGKHTWTKPGTYRDTIPNKLECDSIMTFSLQHFDKSVSVRSDTLIASQDNVSYQWFDCNERQIVQGGTNKTFKAGKLHSFKVILSATNCSDTTAAFIPQRCGEYADIADTNVNIYSYYPFDENTPVKRSFNAYTTGYLSSVEVYLENVFYDCQVRYHFSLSLHDRHDTVLAADTFSIDKLTALKKFVFTFKHPLKIYKDSSYILYAKGLPGQFCEIDGVPMFAGWNSIIGTVIPNIRTNVITSTYSNINKTVCSFMNSPSGKYVWKKQGIYTDTISNRFGCDSIISANLSIILDTSVNVYGRYIIAYQSGMNYQWMDCDTHQPIPLATDQAYAAAKNGNYAVIISIGDCKDTSECKNVSYFGVENILRDIAQVYPNPASDELFIKLPANRLDVAYELFSIYGQSIMRGNMRDYTVLDIHHLSPGAYLLRLSSSSSNASFRIMKK